MSERVYPDALRDFCAVSNSDYQSPSENRRMQDMHKHLLPLLSDSNWRRADGNLAEGGHLEPGEVDLGFGGDYACNEVWDGSLPY